MPIKHIVKLRNGEKLTMEPSTFHGAPCLIGPRPDGRVHRIDPETGRTFCAAAAGTGRAVVLKQVNALSRHDAIHEGR